MRSLEIGNVIEVYSEAEKAWRAGQISKVDLENGKTSVTVETDNQKIVVQDLFGQGKKLWRPMSDRVKFHLYPEGQDNWGLKATLINPDNSTRETGLLWNGIPKEIAMPSYQKDVRFYTGREGDIPHEARFGNRAVEMTYRIDSVQAAHLLKDMRAVRQALHFTQEVYNHAMGLPPGTRQAQTEKDGSVFIPGQGDTVAVYQTREDLESHEKLLRAQGKDKYLANHRLVVGDGGAAAMKRCLVQNPEIRNVHLNFNNDAKGRQQIFEVSDYPLKKNIPIAVKFSQKESWSQDLKAWEEMQRTPQAAKPAPALAHAGMER